MAVERNAVDRRTLKLLPEQPYRRGTSGGQAIAQDRAERAFQVAPAFCLGLGRLTAHNGVNAVFAGACIW